MAKVEKQLIYVIDEKVKSCVEGGEKGVNLTQSNTLKSAEHSEQALDKQNGPLANNNTKVEEQRTTVKKSLFLTIWKETLGSVKATCEKVGVRRETFYEWKKSDPEFRANIHKAWMEKLDDVEQQLNLKILQGDASLIRYFLDRRHPLYKPKVKIDGPTPGDKALEAEFEEMEWVDDNNLYGDDKTKNEQSVGDTEPDKDQKQERADSAIQTEQSPVILLAEKNEKKLNIESSPKGN